MSKNDLVLDMTLRKVHALEIVRGQKVREYRGFSDHWAKRLCLFEDPDDPFLATNIRMYETVHFHPYNNAWYLDCEITCIQWITVNEEFLQKYGHEVKAPIGAIIFVIHLGNVLSTNLNPDEEK